MATEDNYNIFHVDKNGKSEFLGVARGADARDAFLKHCHLTEGGLEKGGYQQVTDVPYFKLQHGAETFSVFKRERRRR